MAAGESRTRALIGVPFDASRFWNLDSVLACVSASVAPNALTAMGASSAVLGALQNPQGNGASEDKSTDKSS